MIVVGMGDENMGDVSAFEGALQRIEMFRDRRAGIDHRHILVAHDINAGALEGERPGIVGKHACDARA